jgi:hypothetical protein
MMSTAPTIDPWALNREVEAEAKARKAKSEALFERFLDRFKVKRDPLERLHVRERQWDQAATLQSELVRPLDVEDDAPVDTRPTPAELWSSISAGLSKVGTSLKNYFDLSYRYVSWDQAVKLLLDAGIVARLGGQAEVIIMGGRRIAEHDGQFFYEDPFTIQQCNNMWVLVVNGREVFARNLDEAVKATIRSYVRDDEATETSSNDATARTSLENAGAVSG